MQIPIYNPQYPYYQIYNPYMQPVMQPVMQPNPNMPQGMQYNPYMQPQQGNQGGQQNMSQGMTGYYYMPTGIPQGMPMPMNPYMQPMMGQNIGNIGSNGQTPSSTSNNPSYVMDPQLAAKFSQNQQNQLNLQTVPPPNNQMNQGNSS
eukprot:jgi/Orpsp1_1/1181832/evm.model.c7180000078796.2